MMVLQMSKKLLTNVNAVHLCSAICISSEAPFVNHLYSALSKGAWGSAGWVSGFLKKKKKER